MRYRKLMKVFLIAALASMGSLAQASDKRGETPASADDMGRVEHVFVIMLENHSKESLINYSDVKKQCQSKAVSYFTSLACSYTSAENYYGVTHPSLPNYVALISGSNWFVNNDHENNRFPHSNLVDQLEAANKTWAGYMESLPGDKLADFWPSKDTALYASKHNPFVLFTNIRNSKKRLESVKPYTDLAKDLAGKSSTPNFALIIPNQCNDMHGVLKEDPKYPDSIGCAYGKERRLQKKAEKFVSDTIDLIRNSDAWKDKNTTSVIFIIADEGEINYGDETVEMNGYWESPAGCCDSPVVAKGAPDISPHWPGGMYGGGHVPAIIIVSNNGKPKGYVSRAPYNHYSLLATIEGIWNLGLLGFASDTEQVKPMTEFLTK